MKIDEEFDKIGRARSGRRQVQGRNHPIPKFPSLASSQPGALESREDEVVMMVQRLGSSLRLLGALLVLAAGCSESGDTLPREAVSGAVTLDGEPLSRGMIQFRPADGGSATAVGGGSIIESGRFSIPRESGLVPGKYKVSINGSTDEGGPRTKGRVVQKSGLAKEPIPSKYNSKSEMVEEVKKGGRSDLKFDLRSK